MDNVFKALLIVILLVFMFLYYNNSDNGRYVYNTVFGKDVLDTKTGTVYFLYTDEITSFDLPNATKKKNMIKLQSIK